MPELEIHCINVSQGDSTLIINRDVDQMEKNIDDAIKKDPKIGSKPMDPMDFQPFAVAKKICLRGTIRKCMLIDAGDDLYGGDVAEYLDTQGVEDNITDFNTLATHYHADHVGGFYAVFFKDFNNRTSLDKQTINLAPKIAYDCGDLPAWDNTSTKTTYRAYISELKRRGRTEMLPITCNDKPYCLGKDKNKLAITLRVLASNGSVPESNSSIPQQVINTKKSADQNARSVTLLLEYGEFRCFLGGDIGGNGVETGGNFNKNKDNRVKKYYSTYADIEAHMTKILPKVIEKDPRRCNTVAGHVCVLSANHHGSASSNDTFFIATMQAKVAYCSAGINYSFHCHPTQEFFQRVDMSNEYSPKWQEPGNTVSENPNQTNTIEAYYITEMAKDGKYSNREFKRTFSTGKILGDIIIRPFGELDPNSANFRNHVNIQVYGLGVFSKSDLSSIELRKTEQIKVGAVYPIGPFTHTCYKH